MRKNIFTKVTMRRAAAFGLAGCMAASSLTGCGSSKTESTTTAKTIANTFVEKGADVIFHASGASGMGMFQAAEEKGFVAIGVNLNQNEIAPDYIMASMLKKLDSCAYHAITSVVEGTYTGENQVLGLSDGGVDVTTEKSNIQVSDSIKEQLDDLKAKVISGEIEVPYELK